MPGGVNLNGVNIDLSQLFGAMGGGMPGGAGGRGRRPMAQQAVECTLEDLFTGARKERRVEGKLYTLEIAAGMKHGTKFNFDDAGVSFVLQQVDHATFTRDGQDLSCTTFPSGLLSIFRGATQQIRMLDGRQVAATFEPFALKATVLGEGMTYRSNGERRKGDLTVYLFVNAAQIVTQVRSWATIVAMLVALYFFLTNPGLVVMAFVGYRVLKG